MGERVVPILIAVLLLGIGGAVFASLNPPAPPTDPSSQSYTLDDLCNRLETGAAGTMVATFTEPTTGPGDTTPMCSLDELFGLLPEADVDCAEPSQVIPGTTYWSLCAGSGFGPSFNSPARLAATGQNTCYDAAGSVISCAGTGQDGEYQMGETASPRFTDNADGTVTDNLTGLIWLKNANCFGTRTWEQALSDANGLASASCGLTDGSVAGDWRLPNIYELESLLDLGVTSAPRIPSGHPFSGVVTNYYYWSSSTYVPNASRAWFVYYNNGTTENYGKTNNHSVWPVRGGTSSIAFAPHNPPTDHIAMDNSHGGATLEDAAFASSTTWYRSLLTRLGSFLPRSGVAHAQLTPPSGPNSPTSQKPSLTQIYNRLTTGTSALTQTGFVGPTSGPSTTTMYSLNDIMGVMPAVDDTNCAQPSDVLDGQTYWGLCSSEWGYLTGTAADVEPDWPAQPAATGQDTCYDAGGTVISCAGTGQDGEYQMGLAWPDPRFTDNSDGTVTDNLTGLIWLKDANCFGTRTWTQALSDANGLASASCSLTDGSVAGDWRLPSRREFRSLMSHQHSTPALPVGHPFSGLVPTWYWSSSTYAPNTSDAWHVDLGAGLTNSRGKTFNNYVWPVR
ncbi:MAG: DUF1566 domain-containing protein [Candidatus Saccharibacteria bacterium]|nr:DUF1566 domain-containing protein [Candidatus Saccharibacteria bacterium]